VPPQAAHATQPSTAQAAIAKPVPLPEARPRIEVVPEKPHRRHLRRYRTRP
jgi:membrane-bound lytic murein transglycosylase A